MDARFRPFTAVIAARERKDVDLIVAAMTDDIVSHHAAAAWSGFRIIGAKGNIR